MQVLSLPAFRVATNDTGDVVLNPAVEIPYLSCLERLTVPSALSNVDVQKALLNYLLRDPPISDLRWGRAIALTNLDAPFPTLPSLRILQDTDMSFIIRFIYNREAGSVKLRVLESIALNSDAEHLLSALVAIDPQALRRVHIYDANSISALRALARMFPCLEELSLPGSCNWANPHPVTRVALALWHTVSLAHPQNPSTRLKGERISIDKALSLFPTLHSINSVNVGDPLLDVTPSRNKQRHVRDPPTKAAKTIAILQKRYPGLRSVNGWSLGPPMSLEARLVAAGILEASAVPQA